MLYRLGERERIAGTLGFAARPPGARRERPKMPAFTAAKIDRILALEADLVLGLWGLRARISRPGRFGRESTSTCSASDR